MDNLIECLFIGGVVPLASIARVVLTYKLDQKRFALTLLIALCLIGAGLEPFMPDISSPEWYEL